MEDALYIIIDDSSQKAKHNKNLKGFGSIWIRTNDLCKLEQLILRVRIKYNCWGEFKWVNIDKNHIEVYKEIIQLFAEFENVFFNFISAIEPKKEELTEYHKGSILRWKYMLIRHLIAYNYLYLYHYFRFKKVHIIADKQILKRGEEKEFFLNKLRYPSKIFLKKIPLVSAVAAHSHILGVLQLSDLLSGLSAYITYSVLIDNSIPLKDSKKELINFCKKNNLDFSPRIYGRPEGKIKINNWFFRPYKKPI